MEIMPKTKECEVFIITTLKTEQRCHRRCESMRAWRLGGGQERLSSHGSDPCIPSPESACPDWPDPIYHGTAPPIGRVVTRTRPHWSKWWRWICGRLQHLNQKPVEELEEKKSDVDPSFTAEPFFLPSISDLWYSRTRVSASERPEDRSKDKRPGKSI